MTTKLQIRVPRNISPCASPAENFSVTSDLAAIADASFVPSEPRVAGATRELYDYQTPDQSAS
jgi:hypothetical protein